MSKIQSVKPLLSAAADEILKDVEKIIAGYEEEMFQSKRRISRQRKMLDAPKPEIKLNTITERLPIEADEDTKMSKMEGLRVLVKHFLSVAADNIVEAVEKMIADYVGEMHQSKREKSQQCKMLHVLLQPEIRLTRIPEEAQLNLSVWNNLDSLQEAEPLPVPSPGFSEPENGDNDDWNDTQDEEWSNSGQHRTPTAKTPRTKTAKTPPTKKEQKSCKVCGKSFHYEGPLVKHLKSHPKEDGCGLCGMRLETEEDFELHMETHMTVKTVKVVKTVKEVASACDVCGKCFARTCNLVKHMRTHTEEPLPVPTSPGPSEPENGVNDDWNATQDGDRSEEWEPDGRWPTKMKKNRISCKVCGKSFLFETSLLKHLKSHPKDGCGLCGQRFEAEEDFKLHVETHKTVKAWVCEVCGKCFTTRSNLETHTKSHSVARPFICEQCGISFKYLGSLTKHLKIHTGEKLFKCDVCHKLYGTQDTLTRHHMIHSGVKPYRCTKCSQLFTSYFTLRKHIRKIHLKGKRIIPATRVIDNGDVNAEVEDGTAPMAKEQQIVCKVCGKDFLAKVSLVNHLESHPKDDCGVCGMHFDTEEDFELHLKTHIEKVCDVCGKCFAKPFYLEIHILSHMGERPFKCSQCGKGFRQRHRLTDHIRIHTGEKPFSCATCGKRFKCNSNLKQHMRVVKHFVPTFAL